MGGPGQVLGPRAPSPSSFPEAWPGLGDTATVSREHRPAGPDKKPAPLRRGINVAFFSTSEWLSLAWSVRQGRALGRVRLASQQALGGDL